MEKNEERKNLTVTVLKLVIMHIHGVLNLGYYRKNTADGNDLSFFFSQNFVGRLAFLSPGGTCVQNWTGYSTSIYLLLQEGRL